MQYKYENAQKMAVTEQMKGNDQEPMQSNPAYDKANTKDGIKYKAAQAGN